MEGVGIHVDAMNDEERMGILQEVLDHPEYWEDPYSDLMRELSLKYKSGKDITKNQMSLVRSHLLFKSKLWF